MLAGEVGPVETMRQGYEPVCSLSLRAIHALTIDYRCSSKSSASTS